MRKYGKSGIRMAPPLLYSNQVGQIPPPPLINGCMLESQNRATKKTPQKNRQTASII